ncbi:MAG: hypothetical protein ABR521_03660 [Gaiellaceae bacterium]
MHPFRPRRPSPALVVACLALLAALGGTGVAAVERTTATINPTVYVKSVNLGPTSAGSALAMCPRGKFATGGGAYLAGTQSADDHLIDSEPARPGTPAQNGFVPTGNGGKARGWHATFYNPNASTRLLHVYVICA